MRGRLAVQYIFFEMLPSFILGIVIFVSILLMFQALRLTEFVLIHGIGLDVVLRIMGYLSVSFLPAIFPMSLLFSVLLTYGRLSSDLEITAFKSVGLHIGHLSLPAILLSLMVAAVSVQTSFQIAPWGNRQFEVIFTKIANTKASATIREGVFSEGFFDLVVYANHVDPKTGLLKQVFIYNEQDSETPLTIVAKEGQLVQDVNLPGHKAFLRLTDGDIHRKTQTHTKIHFKSYDVTLFDPIKEEIKEKTPPSWTLGEIEEIINNQNSNPKDRKIALTEWHKRWAIAVVCVLFALLGVGLGTTTNRRSGKSAGMPLALSLLVLYWILYVSSENMARTGNIPVIIAIWLPNVIFAIAALWSLKRAW